MLESPFLMLCTNITFTITYIALQPFGFHFFIMVVAVGGDIDVTPHTVLTRRDT